MVKLKKYLLVAGKGLIYFVTTIGFILICALIIGLISSVVSTFTSNDSSLSAISIVKDVAELTLMLIPKIAELLLIGIIIGIPFFIIFIKYLPGTFVYRKNNDNLNKSYKKAFEYGMILSLILSIFMLQGYKRFEAKSSFKDVKLQELQVEEIPQTQQEKQAPAPSRPTVPIASEDEDLPEDETIDIMDLDLDEDAPPPPPPPDEDSDVIVFVPYDEPPVPIGGFPAIQKKLVYPEIARKAGVEGRVTIYAQVDENGNVVKTKVVQSLGPNGCDEAAIKAIMSVKWKPAKQRDRSVKVWIAVPVDFRLK